MKAESRSRNEIWGDG